MISEDKDYILIGDFNENLLNVDNNIKWGNFTTSLGLTQLIDEPNRVTTESQTLINHVYTNTEENIQCIAVKKICLSDHFGVFCTRKSQSVVGNKTHQVIKYRSFKHFDELKFLRDISLVPWEIILNFDKVDDNVSIWSTLFLEILDKHAPIKITE